MDLLVASNTGAQCASVIPTEPTTRSRSTFRSWLMRSCETPAWTCSSSAAGPTRAAAGAASAMTPRSVAEIERVGRRRQHLFDRGGGRHLASQRAGATPDTFTRPTGRQPCADPRAHRRPAVDAWVARPTGAWERGAHRA